MAPFSISVHCSVGSLLYLASFVAVSYWNYAFSQMSLVVSVSIFVASVIVVVS